MSTSRLSVLFTLPALTCAAFAQSLDLPGPDGFVSVPHSSALVPQGGITIEAWIKPDSLGVSRPTVVRKNPAAFNESYILRVEYDRPLFIFQTATGIHTLWPQFTIPVGTHTHLAATYDGVTARLYSDWVLIGETVFNAGPLLDTGGELRIGKGDDVSGGETFFGDIDCVRIWDHARTAHQIHDGVDRELPFGDGLIASWNFDDDLVDEANGHDGTANGTTGFAAEFTYFSQCIDLQPGSGFLEVPHAPELVPATGLTVEAWVELDSFGVRPTIVRKDPTPNAESFNFRVEFGSPQLIIQTVTGFHTLWATGTSLPLDTPMHLAGTYDGATMALYLDGQQIASQPASFGPLAASTGPLRIGKGDDNGGEQFLGRIDTVRLWSVGLEAADIAYLRDREFEGLPGMIATWNFYGTYDDSTGGHDAVAVGGAVPFAEQFGDQTAAIDPGVSVYGVGTSTCPRVPRVYVATPSELGNLGFAFGSTGGPGSGVFVNAVGVGALPSPVTVLGFGLLVDITQPIATVAGVADPLGTCRTVFPFPANPAFADLQFYAQTIWFDSCGVDDLTSSNGLAIRLVD